MGKSSTPAQTICWRIGWDDIMGFSKRLLKNPPFTLRQAQGERGRHCNRWRFSVRAEPVEARKRLFQHPVGAGIAIVGDFPFVLSLSKHENDFFSSLLRVSSLFEILRLRLRMTGLKV